MIPNSFLFKMKMEKQILIYIPKTRNWQSKIQDHNPQPSTQILVCLQ